MSKYYSSEAMMKSFFSKFLATLLLLWVANVSVAQTHYDGNLFIGAKGGVNLSRIFFHPGVRQKMAMGATAGFMIRYIEENHFGIIGELNFQQRGWQDDFEDAPFNYHRTLNYIQIPVLAHIYFGSNRAHFFFNAGPEIGFMFAQSTSSNFDPENIATIPDFPIQDRQTAHYTLDANKKLDFGISAGLGVEYFLPSRSSISLEARFYYGLGNVIPTGRTETFTGANSMSIGVTAGYWFRVK